MRRLIVSCRNPDDWLWISIRVWGKNTAHINVGPLVGWLALSWNGHYFYLRRLFR